jgi:multidrug efflux pump subunit AcrB
VEGLIRYFEQRHALVHTLVFVVVVLGILSAISAPRETFPNVSIPTLFVSAHLPGASARDVETKVTIPLEETIEELEGLTKYHTIITDNLSSTTVELDDAFDAERILRAEKDLRNLIDAINDFPEEMEDDPVVTRLNPRLFPVIQVALSGPTDAVTVAAKQLERRIRRLDSVSKVDVPGLQDPELRILVDPQRSRELGVTLLDVVRAVERRNVSSTGGMLESETDRRQVVLWSRFEHPEEVGDTVLRFLPGGGAVHVSDVARIELGREDTGLLAHTNGQPGITVVAHKREDADIVDTADEVRALVESTPLSAGVEAVIVRDESFMTRNRLELMTWNGLLGATLVAVVLFVFLTRSTAIWVLVGIPVVFLGALAVFALTDMSINIITLTGFVVALGLVVDDAVVVAEAVVAKRQQGVGTDEASVQGAMQMSRPVMTSAITTILAFVPMYAIGGMAGRIMFNMPTVVILALSLSVIESFFILPAHLSTGRVRAAPPKRAFVLRMEEGYRRRLRTVLHQRGWLVTAFIAAFLVIMIFIRPLVGVQLFPQDDSEALYIKITTPLGTPLEQTEAVAMHIERQLPVLLSPDLVAVTARVGHQQGSQRGERERGASENEAVVEALFKNLGREKTSAEWIELLEAELLVPLDAKLLFEAEYFGPPVGNPVTIHVASNRDELRRATAQEIAARLALIEGLSNVEVDERPGTPQLDLNLDYEKLALRGLEAEDVAQTLKAAFFGLEASEHRDLDETVTFRVLFDPSSRRSLDALLEVPVRARSGELVRLRDVVNPMETPAVSRIYHRNGERTATVVAAFAANSDHTALTMAQTIEREIVPEFAGIPDLEVYVGGEAVETRKTTADIGVVALLAVAGITVAISLMLGSFLEAFFVIAIIPFSLAAVILTFFVHGKTLSLFAMLGAVGLAGVVVNASIVMVDAIHRRLAEAGEGLSAAQRREALLDAVVSRLRPIVVTTLTTLGGVLPMAYGIGGYDASVAPMSLALGWGLALRGSRQLPVPGESPVSARGRMR